MERSADGGGASAPPAAQHKFILLEALIRTSVAAAVNAGLSLENIRFR
ncbi:hypothetical protein [Citrobacter freundii]